MYGNLPLSVYVSYTQMKEWPESPLLQRLN
jgi:hypothetical protein